MSKHILLGIDAGFSPSIQHALHVVGDLFDPDTPELLFILFHAIPITHVITEQPGYYVEQFLPFSPSDEQRRQAETVLTRAQEMLEQQGFAQKQFTRLIRVGAPADEIIRTAYERKASLIVVGTRGNAWHYRLRRLFMGSISRRILQLAPCPVMIVLPATTPPQTINLTSWYEQAISDYLREHTQSLAVLTPQQVAEQFLPPHKKSASTSEIAAARTALEKLADTGLLYRRGANDEISYVND